ncbi:Uncharacterised protein [uncultured archaeon]|nr:Uncharacterised protein [uncultured archaeon]
MTKTESKTVTIGKTKYDLMNESRMSARVFEAVAARASLITAALDNVALEKRGAEGVKPAYKHTVFLGKSEDGRNLRAGVAVFPNSVVIQTLKEAADK